MITQIQIADKIKTLSGLDVFKITRKREYVEVRSLLNHVLFKYKKMPLHKIVDFYNKNGWNINHATLIYSIKTFSTHTKYNYNLIIWLKQLVIEIDEMDNATKREYIKSKLKTLRSEDIDELTMVISNMPEPEYEK